MKITFLGTAAAEGVPAVFCNCPTCVRAKAVGGREVRTRSQILIDDDTLFDFPMDTYMHMLKFKLDLSKIKRVLITHAHMDHCYPQEFCMRGGPFAKNLTEDRVNIYCDPTVHDIFWNDVNRELRPEVGAGLITTVMHPFDCVVSDDMRIIALPAAHTKGEDCLVYYVERGGAGALFLNDTGPLEREVFEKLRKMRVDVRLVALDCTYGAIEHGVGRHMGLYDIVKQKQLMREVGVADESTLFYATHFSHNTDLDYAGISALASEHDITVAYDGCSVEI